MACRLYRYGPILSGCFPSKKLLSC